MTRLLSADDVEHDPVELDDPTEGLTVPTIEVGSPSVRAVAFDRAGMDGSDDWTRHVGARAVTVTVDLRTRPHTRQALLDRVAPLMHPRRRLWLEHSSSPGQAPRRLLVRPDDAPVEWGNPAMLVVPWEFRTVGAPFWLGEDRSVDLLAAIDAPGFTFPLTFDLTFPEAPTTVAQALNAGTTDAEWVWTVTGPSVGPSLRREDTGEVVSLRGLTLLSGQTAVVDSYARSVTVDGAPHYSAVDQTATDWWRLPAGRQVSVTMRSRAGSGTLAFSDTFYA